MGPHASGVLLPLLPLRVLLHLSPALLAPLRAGPRLRYGFRLLAALKTLFHQSITNYLNLLSLYRKEEASGDVQLEKSVLPTMLNTATCDMEVGSPNREKAKNSTIRVKAALHECAAIFLPTPHAQTSPQS